MLISLFVLLVLGACGGKEYQRIKGTTMGTYYSVQFASSTICAVGQEELERILASVNDAMSTYQEDSELSRFNRAKHGNWQPVSVDLYHVLGVARELWQRSEGAFDVTVGPLVNLWGFGPRAVEHAPSAKAQTEASASVGMQHLKLQSGRIAKQVPALYVDLSALAKGYGVDRMAEYLMKKSCTDFMVDIGGEIRAAGLNSRGVPWQIGIEVPDAKTAGMLHAALELRDMSVATSGDYRNFRMHDGQRVDHVMDPRHGRPALNDVVSATVLHPSAMWADAYATTLMVLGVREGLEFAEREAIAVYLIVRSHGSGTGTEQLFESRYNEKMKIHLR